MNLRSLLPCRSGLGADYDTSWARRLPSRVVRALMIEALTRPAVAALMTPKVVGIDRLVDIEGPVVFAANHASHFDTSLLLTVLPRRFRARSVVAAGADYFFDKRWKAALWSLWMNIIPIERERVGRRSADLTASLLDEGWNVIIYPEGGRTPDGFMHPFRGGAAYLSIRCEATVVPIHIEGTRKILPKGGTRVRWGRTRVTIGEPLRPLDNERARAYNQRIQRAVEVAADEGRTDWWGARARARAGTTPSLQAPPNATGWRAQWLGHEAGPKPEHDERWPA